MIKVSVIVPVYNVEEYIERCLKSLVNQTLEEIEIIVVNDGTKDNSQKIIDKYVKKYPKKVKGYIKENGGLSDARNYGIKKAKGEYIGFVDSDDFVDETMFEKLYNKAKEKDYDIVVSDVINYYDDGSEKIIKSNKNYSSNFIKNYIISSPMACCRLYSSKIFIDNKFKKSILYEDLEFNPSLITDFKNITFLDEPLYYYYQRLGSIMNQTEFNTKLLDIFEVLKNIENKFIKKGKYDEYFNEIEYLYITHLLRTAGLRFSNYKIGKKHINEIAYIFKTKFKNWRKNEYFKKSSIKLKIICYLTFYQQNKLLKILSKFT